jgi:hypothetical protein
VGEYVVFRIEPRVNIPVTVGTHRLEVVSSSSLDEQDARMLLAMSKTPCNCASGSTT